MHVSREAILSRRRLVKNFAFGTCIFTHVSLWATWRARPLRDGQKGNKKHLSCNIVAKRVEKRCSAFYHPYQTCLATNQVVNRFDWRGSGNGQHRFLTCFAAMQNKLHVFVRPSRVFLPIAFSRAFIPLSLPHQPSATKDRGGRTSLYSLDWCVLLNSVWFTGSWVEWRCCALYYPYQTSLAANQVVDRFEREW